jgi:hypothetical protein
MEQTKTTGSPNDGGIPNGINELLKDKTILDSFEKLLKSLPQYFKDIELNILKAQKDSIFNASENLISSIVKANKYLEKEPFPAPAFVNQLLERENLILKKLQDSLTNFETYQKDNKLLQKYSVNSVARLVKLEEERVTVNKKLLDVSQRQSFLMQNITSEFGKKLKENQQEYEEERDLFSKKDKTLLRDILKAIMDSDSPIGELAKAINQLLGKGTDKEKYLNRSKSKIDTQYLASDIYQTILNDNNPLSNFARSIYLLKGGRTKEQYKDVKNKALEKEYTNRQKELGLYEPDYSKPEDIDYIIDRAGTEKQKKELSTLAKKQASYTKRLNESLNHLTKPLATEIFGTNSQPKEVEKTKINKSSKKEDNVISFPSTFTKPEIIQKEKSQQKKSKIEKPQSIIPRVEIIKKGKSQQKEPKIEKSQSIIPRVEIIQKEKPQQKENNIISFPSIFSKSEEKTKSSSAIDNARFSLFKNITPFLTKETQKDIPVPQAESESNKDSVTSEYISILQNIYTTVSDIKNILQNQNTNFKQFVKVIPLILKGLKSINPDNFDEELITQAETAINLPKKFHTGGIIGAKPSIIAQPGEIILPVTESARAVQQGLVQPQSDGGMKFNPSLNEGFNSSSNNIEFLLQKIIDVITKDIVTKMPQDIVSIPPAPVGIKTISNRLVG